MINGIEIRRGHLNQKHAVLFLSEIEKTVSNKKKEPSEVVTHLWQNNATL